MFFIKKYSINQTLHSYNSCNLSGFKKSQLHQLVIFIIAFSSLVNNSLFFNLQRAYAYNQQNFILSVISLVIAIILVVSISYGFGKINYLKNFHLGVFGWAKNLTSKSEKLLFTSLKNFFFFAYLPIKVAFVSFLAVSFFVSGLNALGISIGFLAGEQGLFHTFLVSVGLTFIVIFINTVFSIWQVYFLSKLLEFCKILPFICLLIFISYGFSQTISPVRFNSPINFQWQFNQIFEQQFFLFGFLTSIVSLLHAFDGFWDYQKLRFYRTNKPSSSTLIYLMIVQLLITIISIFFFLASQLQLNLALQTLKGVFWLSLSAALSLQLLTFTSYSTFLIQAFLEHHSLLFYRWFNNLRHKQLAQGGAFYLFILLVGGYLVLGVVGILWFKMPLLTTVNQGNFEILTGLVLKPNVGEKVATNQLASRFLWEVWNPSSLLNLTFLLACWSALTLLFLLTLTNYLQQKQRLLSKGKFYSTVVYFNLISIGLLTGYYYLIPLYEFILSISYFNHFLAVKYDVYYVSKVIKLLVGFYFFFIIVGLYHMRDVYDHYITPWLTKRLYHFSFKTKNYCQKVQQKYV